MTNKEAVENYKHSLLKTIETQISKMEEETKYADNETWKAKIDSWGLFKKLIEIGL